MTDVDTRGFSLQKNPEPVFSKSQDYHRVPVLFTPGAVIKLPLLSYQLSVTSNVCWSGKASQFLGVRSFPSVWEPSTSPQNSQRKWLEVGGVGCLLFATLRTQTLVPSLLQRTLRAS